VFAQPLIPGKHLNKKIPPRKNNKPGGLYFFLDFDIKNPGWLMLAGHLGHGLL
jgi:hypothetical protein